MDEEFVKRLSDYFTGSELLDVLDVPIQELIYLLEDYIIDQRDEIEDYLNYGS